MENPIAAAMLAAQMTEVRGQMRMFLGENYEAKIREHAGLVRTAQERLGMENEFATVLEMDRETKAKGLRLGSMTVMMMTAAAVELTEGAPFLSEATA